MALHHRHNRRISALTAFTLLLFFSASVSPSLSHHGSRVKEREEKLSYWKRVKIMKDEKRLAGPGSSPPSCRSKCDNCTPCKPVHVPIHPGLSMPLEYYPEAWRCQCGNKLFMP